MGWLNGYSLGGAIVCVLLAWLTSVRRRAFPWRTVLWGSGLLMGMAAVVFWWPPFRQVLLWANQLVTTLIAAADEGARFLFGPLALSPPAEGSLGFIVAFQVLPAVVFFSAVTAFLYYVGFLPWVVRWMARAVHRNLRLSGAEALAAVSNIFLGIESALMVRPYLERMTRSELLLVLTSGLATIASTVLAFYVRLLEPVFPLIAGHLISASFLSIPAAVLISKVLYPETEVPETMGRVPEVERVVPAEHWMGSLIWGTWEGVRLAVGIGALLIGMLGLVHLVDVGLSGVTGWVTAHVMGTRHAWTLRDLATVVAYPLGLLLGLRPDEWSAAARLIGERWLLTEVISYQDLAALAREGRISPRGLLVLSYALCGFTHVASVAIFVGGTAALAPARRDDLAALSWRALWAATLATVLTGCIAGAFYWGQPGLIQPP